MRDVVVTIRGEGGETRQFHMGYVSTLVATYEAALATQPPPVPAPLGVPLRPARSPRTALHRSRAAKRRLRLA